MTDGTGNASPEANSFGKLISFRGSLSRGKYLFWLLVELLLLALGMAGLAALNSPTGGPSAAPLFIVFPFAALYLHFCLVPARLRDAGAKRPVLLGLFLGLLPFIWLGLTFEFVERFWPVVLGGFLLLYAGPALAGGPASESLQS